jgi:hypothetical protein
LASAPVPGTVSSYCRPEGVVTVAMAWSFLLLF